MRTLGRARGFSLVLKRPAGTLSRPRHGPGPSIRLVAPRRQTVRADRGRRFRAKEDFGLNAEPYVATGRFVKILGL